MPIPKVLPGSEKKKDAHAIATNADIVVSKPARANVIGKQYNVVHKLGSGNFGTVYLVIDIKNNNERKVVKKIKAGEIQPNETVEAVKEATLLSQLDHPAIVKFHSSFMEEEHFCIVTEYCEGGDLSNMIRQVKEAGKVLEESLILDWFVQLTNAIRYIHDRRVLHRDLKTRNIFLREGKIKLGDFGISRILVGTSDYATTFTGTPYYMSPEVLKHEGYNSKSDIWSLGVVLYELCSLDHAFKGQNMMAVMYKIVEGIPPRLPDHFNSSLHDLFTRMLDKNPKLRPSAIQILQHPFIKHHMEILSHKLTMSLTATKSNPVLLSQATGRSPSKKKLEEKQERAMTPRQRMLQRKSQKADEEAEKIRLAVIKNYSDNQKRFDHIKKVKKNTFADMDKLQNRIVPPWVGEHPDIFDDPNFSITAIDLTKSKGYDPNNESLMELSLEGMALESNKSKSMEDDIEQDEEMIPEDPLVAETYYSQFDDFEMIMSSSSADTSEDSDYQAIVECIEEALGLSEYDPSNNDMLEDSMSQEPEPRPQAPPPPPMSHEEISPFTPLARDKRIALLKDEGRKVLGAETFQKVYEYLKMVRQNSSEVNEMLVMDELRRLTPNARDCFIIDQLVFLEKQHNTDTF